MSDTIELTKIKKIYGEKFKNLCRKLFPEIIEEKGILLNILQQTFSNNCNSLYESITSNDLETDFKELIFNKYDKIKGNNDSVEEFEEEKRTPYEIFDELGYNLYECKTEEELQEFKKYYAPKEELCSFRDRRLEKRYCFWAIKKDVERIKRKDFKEPDKNDEYSKSVLAIQFNKSGICRVEIISRYNHSVTNPNCTLGNDLNRISKGLAKSFENLLLERGLNFDTSNKEYFEIPGYTVAEGRYYKYNMEKNGVYYCPGNIIIENGKVHKIENLERKRLIDEFILDTENKTIKPYSENSKDSFTDDLQNIKRIKIRNYKEKGIKIRKIEIFKEDKKEPIVLEINKDNEIIGYENKELLYVGNKFLEYNRALNNLQLPNLKEVGDDFLEKNECLQFLNLPSLELTGDRFLFNNEIICDFKASKLKEVGDDFLGKNESLQLINLPELETVENNFLRNNEILSSVEAPKLRVVGNSFLHNNQNLKSINLPQLQLVNANFLHENKILNKIQAPELKSVGMQFLYSNEELKSLDLPRLLIVYDFFMTNNKKLSYVNLPSLQKIERGFLCKNTGLTKLYLPNLELIDPRSFLGEDLKQCELEAPKLDEKTRNSLPKRIVISTNKFNTRQADFRMIPENVSVK